MQSPIYAAYTTLPYETEYVRDNNGDLVLDENGQKQYNFVGFGWSITEALANNPEFEGNTTLLANINLESTITDKLTTPLTLVLTTKNLEENITNLVLD